MAKVLGHEGLKIGGGDVFGLWAGEAPFHVKAVGQAAEHAEDPKTGTALHAATILVEGNVQTLMQPAFDAPARAIEFEPGARVQRFRAGAGDQRDFFPVASGGLSRQACDLRGEGKTDLLAGGGRGAEGAIFLAAFVGRQGARFSGAGLVEGENRL